MEITRIRLAGYGEFREEAGSFTCRKYHLPREWDWVLTNDDALLRLRHDGAGYLQLDPPGGSALFKQDRGHETPSMFVWLIPESKGKPKAFSNFYKPVMPLEAPGVEPDKYTCTFKPEVAEYALLKDNWLVETSLFVPPVGAAVVMTVEITNRAKAARKITAMPVLTPHMAPFSLDPWDIPAIYQTSAFFKSGDTDGIWLETRNPGGDSSKRLRAAFLTDMSPTHFEVGKEDFIGKGSWESPEAVWNRRLNRTVRGKSWPYCRADAGNAVIAEPPVAAFARKLTLAPGRSCRFSLVFGKLPDIQDGSLPEKKSVMKLAENLKEKKQVKAKEKVAKRYGELFSGYRLNTPDNALNRYFTEFLMMQLDWVTRLDRGWPTGMRGVRDCAQDVSGVIPTNPELVRTRLQELFECERSDGWFVRQYSTSGPEGNHDLREYVDSAIWVWECLYDYVCHTRDFAFLNKKLRWLDTKSRSRVLDHAIKLFDYYLEKKNLGKHGLCKIRGGDWNDSVNRAGLMGIGESVMVSCQVVLGLTQIVELLRMVAEKDGKSLAKARKYEEAAKTLKANLNRHALNKKGYYNGVFTDAGTWVFSPRDPDGRKRVSGTVNSFAIISGVAGVKARKSVLKALSTLKGPHGWRLFSPGIGNPPIQNLGRIGSGDLAIGIAENGTCYNHGAHGFLGRAAWTAGEGEMLQEILRYMLPYDQKAHPVNVARAAPYAVVNHWREGVGQEGHGGDTFLSGSITTAVRNIYQGMIGFRPGLSHLIIDPCVPGKWKAFDAEVPFLDARYRIAVRNPKGTECGVMKCLINGRNSSVVKNSKPLNRKVVMIPIDTLTPGEDCAVEIVLG